MKKYAPYQQRVIDEKTELDDKIQKLHGFIKTSDLADHLHREQIIHMRRYSAVLGVRIAGFVPSESLADFSPEEVTSVPTPLMRAKLQVTRVVPEAHGTEVLHMEAVTNGTPEDNNYSKWTPAASLDIAITNPDLHGAFSEGDKFYVDFSLAYPEPAVVSTPVEWDNGATQPQD